MVNVKDLDNSIAMEDLNLNIDDGGKNLDLDSGHGD